MVSKEEQDSFENIMDLLSISEQLLFKVSQASGNLENGEIFSRLNIIDDFIVKVTTAVEALTRDYKYFVDNRGDKSFLVQEDIKKQVTLIMISLNDCKEKLLENLSYE